MPLIVATHLADALVFIIVISVLILVHEIGHLLAAKIIGVGVEEFGLGLPPRITGKKIRGILYSINWLPVGGFVRLSGEDEENPPEHPGAHEKKFFWARSASERTVILLAGVFMNFILAVLLTAYLFVGGLRVPSHRVTVVEVQQDTPAEAVGVMVGDVIADVLSQDATGTRTTMHIGTALDLQAATRANLGREITLVVTRGSETVSLSVVPRTEWPGDQGPMGIRMEDSEVVRYSWWRAPWEALRLNVERLGEVLVSLGSIISRLFKHESVAQDVAGPIRIAQVTSYATRIGFRAIVELMSIISINLAVLNVLPIPALDGGRLFFILIEKVTRRRVRPSFERFSHQIGMILLLALVLLISINDIVLIARGS